MMKREADELTLIENAITINPVTKTAWFRYPMIKNPEILQDNRTQVIGIETSVQKTLINKGQLELYNDVVRDYIKRGVIRKLSQEELDEWDGPVNYVPHHAVEAGFFDYGFEIHV